MMSKTHLAVGVACSLAAAPATSEGLFYAVLGGSIGSMICDIDRSAEGTARDSRVGWLITAVITIGMYMQKAFFSGAGLSFRGLISDPLRLVCFALLILLFLFAISGSHRGFSHSLLMFVCSFVLVFVISRQMSLFYGIGFLTHLVLDLMNRRPVKIFYPHYRGYCLNWCYCDGIVNRVMLLAGSAAVIWLLVGKFGVQINRFRL